jgi:hypothetical protein
VYYLLYVFLMAAVVKREENLGADKVVHFEEADGF